MVMLLVYSPIVVYSVVTVVQPLITHRRVRSDTEEYKQIKHAINPVLGCYEPPRPDPFAGMSEEQKEYEAMKLVNLMDQLNRQGVVQPCRIGPDGRPEAVEHILELQDGIPQQQLDHKRKT